MKEPYRMFWLVWNESKGLPKHKHWTESEAKTEAHRLAMANPGQEFHVLSLIASCAHNAVIWRMPGDEIPF